MLLEEASSDVEEGVEGEFVDDIGDALCGNCRLGRVHLKKWRQAAVRAFKGEANH